VGMTCHSSNVTRKRRPLEHELIVDRPWPSLDLLAHHSLGSLIFSDFSLNRSLASWLNVQL
jgi:hypothetical protein